MKPKQFTIMNPVFGQNVTVFVGPVDWYIKRATQIIGCPVECVDPEGKEALMSRISWVHTDGREANVWLVLWFPRFRRTTDCYARLVHEVSHLVDNIMEQLGIPPGKESTEVRAYLSDFYVREFLKEMGRK